MSRTIGLVGGAVLCAVLLTAWWVTRPGTETVVVDLVATLDEASRRPSPEAFSAVDARLDGEVRRAILVTQPSRLTWSVEVPDHAVLRVAVALREDAWDIEGDGVLFQVGVSDGGDYAELFNVMINPFRNEVDRAWHEVALDLGDYTGRRVDLIFNTRSSAPEVPPDVRGDFALWGAPRLVAR